MSENQNQNRNSNDKVILGEASFSQKEGSVGSNPTPGFMVLSTYNSELLNFALWLFKKGKAMNW